MQQEWNKDRLQPFPNFSTSLSLASLRLTVFLSQFQPSNKKDACLHSRYTAICLKAKDGKVLYYPLMAYPLITLPGPADFSCLAPVLLCSRIGVSLSNDIRRGCGCPSALPPSPFVFTSYPSPAVKVLSFYKTAMIMMPVFERPHR